MTLKKIAKNLSAGDVIASAGEIVEAVSGTWVSDGYHDKSVVMVVCSIHNGYKKTLYYDSEDQIYLSKGRCAV